MKVLLSIKPEFAVKIFSGEKKFEFRKSIFKRTGIQTVIVYASSPICLVIGEFKIDQILESNPEDIWQRTNKYSGISENYFFEYFSGRKLAYAIQIKDILKYDCPLSLREHFDVFPPQSFLYLK